MAVEDFVETQPVAEVNSFFNEEDEARTTSAKHSSKNVAASAALLSPRPESLTELYQISETEFEETGRSATANEVIAQAKQGVIDSGRDSLIEFLGDDRYTDDEKRLATSQFLSGQAQAFETTAVVAGEALITPSDDKNEEAAEVRASMADILGPRNEFKRKQQIMINQFAASSKPSTAGKVADFLEFLVPFANNKQVSNILGEASKKLKGGEGLSAIKGALLPGHGLLELKELVENIPPEQRAEATQVLLDIFDDEASIFLPGDNDFARMLRMQEVINGEYSEPMAWVDDIIGLLDMFAVTKLLKSVTKVKRVPLSGVEFKGAPGEEAARAAREEEEWADSVRLAISTSVQPVAPAKTVGDVNPSKARGMNDVVVADETGEAAEALYGTNRNEAIAHDSLPPIGSRSGKVDPKVPDAARNQEMLVTPDAEIMDFVNSTGLPHYYKDEKAKFRANVINDFQNAGGLKLLPEMSQFIATGGGITVKAAFKGAPVSDSKALRKAAESETLTINAAYGRTEGGFNDAEDAINQTRFSLRQYGVLDTDVTLMVKGPEGYTPVSLDDVRGVSGDYITVVKQDLKIDPSQVDQWSAAGVKRNFFDRMPFLTSDHSGSLSNHLLDAHSMLEPEIALGASVAADKASGLEKRLLDISDDFAKEFKGLDKDRKGVVYEYIKEANKRGLDLDRTDLVSRGFSGKEIEALQDWRRFWDTHYWLENRDLARTLRSRKFGIVETANTRLFVKPVPKNRSIVQGYDPVEEKMVTLTPAELDQLYEKGGSMGQLRNRIDIDGGVAEYTIIRNNSESYLRNISDYDKVLNYNKGYFTTYYDAPKYVVQKVKDATGKELYEKAIAVAGDHKEAVHILKQKAGQQGMSADQFGFVRSDIKKMDMGNDDYWNIQVAGGRTAQRVRGKRLEDSTEMNHGISDKYVLDPQEALVNAARSVSTRASMRDFLEASKQRFIHQFSDFFPKDRFQQPTWPKSVKDIQKPGNQFDSDVADARTSFMYINSLENGYINGIDETSKAFFQMMADITGKAGFAAGERGLNVIGNMAPTHYGKNLAFQLYLALSPQRQLLIQSHQAVRLAAMMPKYVGGGTMQKETGAYLGSFVLGDEAAAKLTRMDLAEFKSIKKFIQDSGQLDGVDKNNLVRSAMLNMADNQVDRKLERFKSITAIPRKIGFDMGEKINLVTSLLAFRRRALDRGIDLSDTAARDKVYGEARNFTGNMNFAGDMPYNQNSVNLLTQFLQVPHKLLTQVLFNRVLTNKEKLRMLAFDTVMWGTPLTTTTIPLWFGDILPEDATARQAVQYGIEGLIFNKLINAATDGKTDIDFSTLAPSDIHGVANLFHNIWVEGWGEMLAKTPSGQLLKEGGRVRQMLGTVSRFIGTPSNYTSVKEYGKVAHSFASLSSGYSNAFKAQYMLEYGQKVNSADTAVTDPDVTAAEAIAAAFGFQTMHEARSFATGKKIYDSRKALQDDVKLWLKDYTVALSQDGLRVDDLARISKTYNEAWRVWAEIPEAKAMLDKEMKKMYSNGNFILQRRAMQASGWMSENEYRAMVKEGPFTDKQKGLYNDIADQFHKEEGKNE